MNAKDLNRPNPRMHRRRQTGRTHMIRCAERRSECTELPRLDAGPEPGEQRTRFAHRGMKILTSETTGGLGPGRAGTQARNNAKDLPPS